MDKDISKSEYSFNLKLYLVLVIVLVVPTIYRTLRIFYLGDLPEDDGLNIASQIIWLNVIFEVIQEALILPLFYLIGKSLNDPKELDNKIKTGIISTGVVYLILVLIIYFNSELLLSFMAQKESIIKLSGEYIKLESIAIFLSVIFRFTSIVLILLNKVKKILILLIVQTILTCICDTFLLSEFSFSLRIGVIGIAYGNIIVSSVLIILSLYILILENILWLKRTKLRFSWMKGWLKIGAFSGLESLIRNTVFIVMILRMINLVEGQSDFWVSNSFIWGWLLIPILALGDLVKRDVGENNYMIKKVIKSSFIITTIIIGIWILSIPLWNSLFINIFNVADPRITFRITIFILTFYIAFAFNNIIDSVFYGLGRTDLMLVQSIVINIVFYGSIYILFRLKLFKISLDAIVFIFGIGILLDTIFTFWIYRYMLRKERLVIQVCSF